jgi:lysophospholipase L1-like esterase
MAIAVGILLVIVAGALEGLFSLPVTRTPRWRWENVWGLGSLVALLLVPWPVAFVTVPNLGEVFRQVNPSVLVSTLLFGIAWGLGGIFWGKSIAALGMALGISLLMGLINIIGSPVLLAFTHGPGKLLERGGLTLLAAVAVMVIGVIICAIAGAAKERDLRSGTEATPDMKSKTPFAIGLMLCIISALFSSMLNFGLVYGEPIKQAALKAHAMPAAAPNAIWALVFTGNYAVNAIYGFYLMFKNKTAGLIVSQGSPAYWLGILFMGIAWPLGVVLYGIGADRMGDYGAFVGFPMMLVISILVANLAGALTGEWRGASTKTKSTMVLGVLVLVASFAIFGASSMLLSSEKEPEKTIVQGESLLLVKNEPANLCFDPVVKGSLTIRNTFAAGKQDEIVYVEGRDYIVDYEKGTVARTADSRIPDYSTHCLYGLNDFDHTQFPDCSNHKWYVWAEYQTTNGKPWAQPNDQSRQLAAVRKKLEAGGPFKIVSYGDSITAGGEASAAELRFTQRFANYLQSKFPQSKIELLDVSIPGYSSQQGIDWFDQKVEPVEKPDLVLVGFGMNDHNKGGPEPENFKNNLIAIVKLIRDRKGAEVVLFSAFPPKDNWIHSSHRMEKFAAVTRQAATESNCAYADVYGTWEMVLKRKDQSSLFNNNINHPNDFGHWLYEQAFEAMQF